MDNQFAGIGPEPNHHQPKQIEVSDSAQATSNEPVVSHHEPKMEHHPKKRKFKKLFRKLWPPNKYTYITAGVVFLIAAGLVYLLVFDHHKVIKKTHVVAKVEPLVPL